MRGAGRSPPDSGPHSPSPVDSRLPPVPLSIVTLSPLPSQSHPSSVTPLPPTHSRVTRITTLPSTHAPFLFLGNPALLSTQTHSHALLLVYLFSFSASCLGDSSAVLLPVFPVLLILVFYCYLGSFSHNLSVNCSSSWLCAIPAPPPPLCSPHLLLPAGGLS